MSLRRQAAIEDLTERLLSIRYGNTLPSPNEIARAKVDALRAINGGSPRTSSSATRCPTASPRRAGAWPDYSVLLRRIGVTGDVARVERELAQAKPGDVIRLVDGTEFSRERDGSINVHRGRNALRPVRTVAVHYGWRLDGNNLKGAPSNARGR
jgi:hypothetical protein